mmetsp:Transcript_40269/g.127051  ORF Transcript_40269/g.127051 Transcript_40269/m.127051 type:complete len:138 (+) Transcript_40269:126-539(+)
MKIVVDRSTRGPASPPPWPRSHLHNRHHRVPPARRFHFPNHVDTKFCAKYVDPSKCPELGPRTNTEAAEQAFAFLARSKHIFRHMNEARFTFTILRLLELRNRDKTRRAPARPPPRRRHSVDGDAATVCLRRDESGG